MIPSGAAPGGVQWSDLAAKLQSDWDQIGVKVEIKQVANPNRWLHIASRRANWF